MSHFNREKAKNVAVVILLLLGLWQKPVEINAQRNSYPVCPMGKEWNFCRDFSDEFNGTGLDRNKWMDLVPVWYGRKPSLFSAANVKVADGVLQLVCDEQKPDEVTYENKIQGFDKFRIAIAKSKNRIRYGYFEARCKSMKKVFYRNNDYFKRALHIVFDCETLWGIPDSSDLPAVFNIDYIRVWQYAGNSYSVAH